MTGQRETLEAAVISAGIKFDDPGGHSNMDVRK